MPVLESATEIKVVEWAQLRRFLTPKVRFVENGYPDRLFISPYGHTIFIEFKREGETPEPLQQFRMLQLRQRGVPAFWFDNLTEAISVLQEALDPASVPSESDQAASESGGGRVIPGPWTGENEHGFGDVQDPATAEASKQDVDNRTAEALLQSLARRDREMGRLLQPALDYLTRRLQGGETPV